MRVEECFASSDHSILNFTMKLPCFLANSVNKTQIRKYLISYNKADWSKMQKILCEIDWDQIFVGDNVNESWTNFKRILAYSVNSSNPFRKRQPWCIKSNPKIRSALRFARRCSLLHKTQKNSETLLKLIHAKDHLQNLINQQVLSYEHHTVDSLKDNSRRYWSYVNSKLSNKRNFFDKIKLNNEIIDDPRKIAETLNNQFYNRFNKNSDSMHTNRKNLYSDVNPYIKGLNSIKIEFATVRDIIRALPNKRSQDLDGFSYSILKGGGDILALQLTRLFIMSIQTKTISRDWRVSVIFPLKKKSNSIDVADFRPINVTSCICRLLERIIRKNLYCHLIGNNLIYSSQHGFLKCKSTTTALLTYTNDLVRSLDESKCVDSAYFDFSKAFDSVRHDLLFQKLINIGINGTLLKWIIDYFSNRTQIVNFHGYVSTEKQLE